MVGFLIFIGYLAGMAFSTIFLARRFIESVERQFPNLLRNEEDYRNESIDCTLFGLLASIIWPVTLTGYFIYRNFITKVGVIETDRYRRMKAERELAEMRQLAREHNLPMPEDIDSPGANGYY